MKEGRIRRTGGNGRSSSCVSHGGVLYIGGVTPTNLEADLQTQAADVFAQLDKLMEYHGTNNHNILAATVYLRDVETYGDFNAVWDRWVTDGYEPTRNLVEAKLALPGYHLQVSLVVALEE